ncbi:MAG: hypothetical protein ABJK11_14510 [Balneola sp.]
MDISEQKSKSDQIKEELHNAFNTLEKRAVISGVFAGISVFLGFIVLLISLEQFQFLSSLTKIIFLTLGLFSGIVLFIWVKNKNIPNSYDAFYKQFARTQHLNEINYYLDLEKDELADPALVQAALEDNLSSIDHRNFKTKLSGYSESQTQTLFFKRSVKVVAVAGIFFTITAFAFSDGAVRTAYLWETFEKPNPYSFTIEPGNITLEQGSPFSASINFENDLAESVQLFVKTEVENEFRSLNMNLISSDYTSIPFNLNNNLEYFVEMDGFKSETYTASVQLRPRFSEFSAAIVPPAYTRLDSSKQAYPFSLVRAYQGSTLKLSGLLNKEIDQFKIYSGTSAFDEAIQIDDINFESEFIVTKPDTISFLMMDKNRLNNKNSFQFIIEPLEDEYPIVELIEPSASFEMVGPKDLDLTFKATDDFNITRGQLHYELKKAYVENATTSSLRLNKPENGVLQKFNWDISALNLSSLDELTFWIEATDNDGYNGRKSARSQQITLTIPSLVDYFESLDKKEDDVEKDLESISESFEEMSESYDEFKESLKENPETTYENRLQIEDAERKQEEVQKKIDELNEKFDEIKKELSANNLLSEETQKAYDELKKLMEEIDDPDLKKALEMLRENMDQLSPEQLRQAMENVEFNEEDFKKRLERTMELFKQLKLMSDMEKLAKSFEDQARQEKELAENPPSDQEAENKRKEDLEQLDKLKEAIDKLSENKSEKTEETVSEYQKQTKEELSKNIEEKIKDWLEKQEPQESGENENGDNKNSKSQNQQPNLEQPFQKLAEKTRQQMQSMGQQQQQINIAGLQYILYSLLNLSDEQEDLVYLSESTEDRSLAYVEFARDQRNVNQIFNSLSDSLFELSKNIPQLSNQLNSKSIELKKQLQRSLTQMAERSQRNSSVASRQSYGGINEIAFMIANLLEQLQDQNGSGGKGGSGMPQSLEQMIEQMGKMKGDQQQMNDQLQQMINDMQGERLSNDQMQRLDQLAKQQNRIRKELQQIQRNGGLEGDKAGSEIQRMIEEMEDTINDLRGGSIDPTLIKRQQNILSRMLEAEKSMQERDEEEKKREGKQPGDFERVTPSDITLEELEKQIRTRLNDPNFTKYSPDYQKLIEQYFELLKKLQKRNS